MKQPLHLNPLLAIGTPCTLSLECVFNADDGQFGRFALEKELLWPGVPMLGQTYAESNACAHRPSLYEIASIEFDSAADTAPCLYVSLKELDLGKWLRGCMENEHLVAHAIKPPFDRDTCIDCVQHYIGTGWKLVGNEADWYGTLGIASLPIRFDKHGNCYERAGDWDDADLYDDDDDDDDDWDDDGDDDDLGEDV